MTVYLVRRTVEMALVLLLASALIFGVLHLSPGGPFDELAFEKGRVSQAYIENLNRLIGLDRPIHVRYVDWLGRVVQGDLGTSWRVTQGQPVTELIQSRLGSTLVLMGTAFVVSLVLATFVGTLSALKQYSLWDYLVTALSFFGLSMPVFWFGLLLVIVFSLQFREWGLPFYLPVGSMYTVGKEGDVLDLLWHLILPVTLLSSFLVARWSRFIRSSLLDVLGQDYIRTARAKGLRERTVVLRHGLRNALIPVITVVTLELPALFGGATVTEAIFAWPGMGHLLYTAILASDWPVAMGILMVSAALIVSANLLADLLYALIDPRIRYN